MFENEARPQNLAGHGFHQPTSHERSQRQIEGMMLIVSRGTRTLSTFNPQPIVLGKVSRGTFRSASPNDSTKLHGE